MLIGDSKTDKKIIPVVFFEVRLAQKTHRVKSGAFFSIICQKHF